MMRLIHIRIHNSVIAIVALGGWLYSTVLFASDPLRFINVLLNLLATIALLLILTWWLAAFSLEYENYKERMQGNTMFPCSSSAKAGHCRTIRRLCVPKQSLAMPALRAYRDGCEAVHPLNS